MNNIKGLSKADFIFLLYLLTLVSVYAVHLLAFTLFEGFSTFSSDAGSYVVLAQKWSPFFQPSDAALFMWPIQILPPGFPWALAITGMSKSLWSGHLLVSMCMLISIFLVGWMAYRRLGWLIGGMVVLGLCLLPGVLISSMGILSENLYLLLSLTALLLFSHIKKNKTASWAWYLALLFSLALVILTRTIGIALIAAIFLVALFDKDLPFNEKIGFYVTAILSIALWLLWGSMNPQTSYFTYGTYLEKYLAAESIYGALIIFWHDFNVNLMQILSSWNHYLSLSHSNAWFFLFSYSVFILCLIGLGLRFIQAKLDAVYIVFYITILLIWPYPTEMTRFLHPIVFLLMLQPVFYFGGKSYSRYHFMIKTTLITVIIILITNTTIVQYRLIEQKETTMKTTPEVAHSFEVYNDPSIKGGLLTATVFAGVMKYMAVSSNYIPIHNVVATVKPTNYSILANRRAVNLVAIVSYLQQLCNLKIMDVDVVLLSALITQFNFEGLTQLKKFRNVSSNVQTLDGGVVSSEYRSVAHILTIDKIKLNSVLVEEGYICQSFQEHL